MAVQITDSDEQTVTVRSRVRDEPETFNTCAYACASTHRVGIVAEACRGLAPVQHIELVRP